MSSRTRPQPSPDAPAATWPRVLSVVVGAAAGLFVAFPAWWGPAVRWPFLAQVVALRPLWVLGAAFIAVMVALIRPWRGRWPLVAAAATIAVVTTVVLVGRGLAPTGLHPNSGGGATTDPDGIVVITANTQTHVDAATITSLIHETGADIIVLPETSATIAGEVVTLLAPTATYAIFHDGPPSGTYSTALLVSERLGTYGKQTPLGTAAGSFVVTQLSAGEVAAPPVIGAVHPLPPVPVHNPAVWQAEMPLVAQACAQAVAVGQAGAVVAGDFNATVDHMAMGACASAASHAGAGAVGTWPTGVPALLGTAIDHVIVDTGYWQVAGATILDSGTLAGWTADHRVLAVRLVAK